MSRSVVIRFRYLLLLSALCTILPGCREPATVQTTDDGKTSVSLALNWFVECEHGGFVAADVHGFFKDEQLQVDIIPGSVGAPQQVITELAAGRILFAVSDADNVVKARAAGVPLVAVMTAMQNSPRCIMVHRASGITSLQELSNVELAISESRPFALWMKKKLPLSNVSMVPFSGSVGEFLLKPDFAQQGFIFSEPFVAKEKGGDPLALMVSDLGFNPYASLLVTTEDVIEQQPELVERVVRACLRGWQQYLDDPTQTNQAINAQNSDMSLAALQYGAQEMVKLCQVRTADGQNIEIGHMDLNRWTTLVQQIEEIGEIDPGKVIPQECFSIRFLSTSRQK